MTFSNNKKTFLDKIDKSSKGSVDAKIKKLVDKINSKEEYFTLSSCSGRILILNRTGERKADWLYSTHDEAKEINVEIKENCWFKQEPFILHVCCKTLDDANKLMTTARDIGLKRSGVIALRNKIVVEIIGMERMETILTKEMNEDYLKQLIVKANEKLKKNNEKIDELFSSL